MIKHSAKANTCSEPVLDLVLPTAEIIYEDLIIKVWIQLGLEGASENSPNAYSNFYELYALIKPVILLGSSFF